jgi:hypothetical protein
MFKFLKSLFGGDKQINQEAGVQIEQVPYKVEPPIDHATVAASMNGSHIPESKVAAVNKQPVKCGCGRSSTGLCVGLHKLTEEAWAAHDANPNKVVSESKPAVITAAKKPAAKKAAAKKPAAKKAAAKKKPAK